MDDIPTYQLTPLHAQYSDNALKSVGEFFLACACAETSLMYLLGKLQCHPNKLTLNSLLVLTGMQNKVMIQKISEAIQVLAPAHHKELDKLCSKIRALFGHRNNLAHNIAILGGGDLIKITVIGLGKTDLTYNTKQIQGFTERLYQVVRHLNQRLVDIGLSRLELLPLPTQLAPGHPQP